MSNIGTVKIETITISNFRGIEKLELTNLDPHMNIIVGVNGAGKSSILDSAAMLLSWLIARLKSSAAKGQMPKESDIRIGSKVGCHLGISLYGGPIWELYKSGSYSDRKKNATHDFNTTDLSGLSGFADYIIERGMYDGGIPIVMYYPVERAVVAAPVSLPRKKEKNVIWDAYKNALSGNANFKLMFEWYRQREDIENEIIRDSPGYRDRSLDAIRRAIRMFFPDFSEMRVRRRPSQSMVISKGEQTIEFTQLSQGEKCYLSLICDIARRLAVANPELDNPLEGEGIILIDEIDLHLHPKWQAEIASKLTAAFPNCQFILSTHSPQVLSDMKREQIIAIDNGRQLQISFDPYGKLSSSILTNYFDLPQSRQRNQAIATDIESAFSAIRAGEVGKFKTLQDKLLPILGAADRDMVNLIIEAKRKGMI